MTATIYGNPQSFRTQKVLVAAKVANKKVEVKDTTPPQGKFPLQVTPAYEEGSVTLFTASAIAKHLAESDLTYVPKDHAIDQWLVWSESELSTNVLSYVLPSISLAHVDNEAVETAKKELFAQLQHLDKLLLTRTYLVTERLTVADVSVALDVLPAFQHVLDDKSRKQLVNLTRWFTTVVNQPIVKDIVGEVQLADKVAAFNLDTYKKSAAQQQPAKKDDKKHENKKAEKKDKPKEKPKEAEDVEDEPLEPKFTDPFLQFPAGEFNVDQFKRVYSNEDTITKAIPHFWEHFDPEHYSLWYGEYKFPEELSLVFMSCNLITGMFQRLEKMKKHAFGSVCLFGKDNASTISGVWFWRGPKLAFELSPDWQVDYESYEWKKLEPKDESTKKLVNAYFSWEGFEAGKEFNQGKIFK